MPTTYPTAKMATFVRVTNPSRALSLRRRSEEIPALPAVSPATLPAAISPALRALVDPIRGIFDGVTERVSESSIFCPVLRRSRPSRGARARA